MLTEYHYTLNQLKKQEKYYPKHIKRHPMHTLDVSYSVLNLDIYNPLSPFQKEETDNCNVPFLKGIKIFIFLILISFLVLK